MIDFFPEIEITLKISRKKMKVSCGLCLSNKHCKYKTNVLYLITFYKKYFYSAVLNICIGLSALVCSCSIFIRSNSAATSVTSPAVSISVF